MIIQADELCSIYGICTLYIYWCEDLHGTSLFKKRTVLEFLNNLWGAGNQVGIGLSYRPGRLAESIPWNWFLGSLKSFKTPSLKFLLNLKRAPPRPKGDLWLGIILIHCKFLLLSSSFHKHGRLPPPRRKTGLPRARLDSSRVPPPHAYPP